MNNSAKEFVTIAMLHNSMAKKYIEYVKDETKGEGKLFVNRLINRHSANQNDVYTRINDENKKILEENVMNAEIAPKLTL